MMTLYPPLILSELRDHHIFLDTGVFITASKSKSFVELLVKLRKESNCSFTTIESVVFEFTNGSDSIDIYNARLELLNSLIDSITPVGFLRSISDFYVVMAKVNAQNKAYTDFLLAACLYNFQHAPTALISTDLKALPSFFPRDFIITVEQDSTSAIRNLGVYSFDTKGYTKAAQKVLEES